MNKCEWKEGVFYPCSKFEPSIVNDTITTLSVACDGCGEFINKPEPPEPLIVKSGDTWVAHRNGVDYLCVKGMEEITKEQKYRMDIFLEDLKENPDYWKPFSEIELTDDIAKLRPLCRFRFTERRMYEYTEVLVYFEKEKSLYLSDEGCRYKVCRLATAKEILEA